MQELNEVVTKLGEHGLTTEQRRRLVEAILDVPNMEELGRREAIVRELPRKIRSAIEPEASARGHLANIVRTCLDFSDGLSELVAALRFFYDGTAAFTRLTALLPSFSSTVTQSQDATAPTPKDPRRGVLRGIEIATHIVAPALGPTGRKTVLERKGDSPLERSDAFTVLKELELEETLENLGAKLVATAAIEMRESVGDGLATAAVLAQSLSRGALECVAAGANPIRVRKGIETAAARVIDDLAKQAAPVTNEPALAGLPDAASGRRNEQASIRSVAALAANDSEIGYWVAEAIDRIGHDGALIVEESQDDRSSLDLVKGLRVPQGYASPKFITDSVRMEAVLENVYILALNQKIALVEEILPVLELAAQQRRPMAIFAGDGLGDALAMLILNKERGTLANVVIKMTGVIGDRRAVLEDMAVLSGGRIADGDGGVNLDSVVLTDLGQARKIVVTKQDVTVVEGAGSEQDINSRIEEIKRAMESVPDAQTAHDLAERVARLEGRIAVIKVGGSSETAVQARTQRCWRAIAAARAAIEEGVVPGGGVALLNAQRALDNINGSHDEQRGAAAVRNALEAPLRTLAENAGFDGPEVVAKVRNLPPGHGFDAVTETYGDMAAAGIIDATKVLRLALQSAASIASQLLTSEILAARGAG